MKREEFETQLNEQLKELQKKFNNNATVLNYLNRGLCQCYNNPQNGVLVLGINPSFDKTRYKEAVPYTFEDAKHPYFNKLRILLGDLADKTGYLDMFPIKESVQNKFSEDIIGNEACLPLIVDLVTNAQREIEALKPRLVILKNQQLAPFVGLHNKFTWMGYQFEEVPNPIEGKKVNFYRIIGIKSDNVSGIAQTNLVGTCVLQYGLYDARHEKMYPNRILQNSHIKQLWDLVCKG